ncbi:DUF5959 family protein [Streptomyces sp. CB02400]|uniref:DUF5959 family protein n=1 Tax=Streptomyces sp. CB02400 TaxID=1703944 RepID=UPI000939A0D7|nr:DUF5959 family protein [Streptomyces sp. CB02400]OKK02070.1 hypothetical protein AMK33_27060 [Streptomyces sp. CB02400]
MFPFELVRLTDFENEVRITVQSAMDDASWEARIEITSLFVKGSTLLVLSRAKLDSWGQALEALSMGQDITWMRTARGPTVSVQLEGERDCPEVVVEDESISMVTVRIPIALEDGWIADHQVRVRRFIENL